jgi:hypothetical protein
VSLTPFYVGHQDVWQVHSPPDLAGFNLTLNKDGGLEVYRDGTLLLTKDLGDWAAAQTSDQLTQPWIDFAAEGVNFRIVLTSASWRRDGKGANARAVVTGLVGLLFADSGAVTISRP